MTAASNELCQAPIAADEIDLSDPFRPTGPYGIAKLFAEHIVAIKAELPSLSLREQNRARARMRHLKQTMIWCKSRAGYVEP